CRGAPWGRAPPPASAAAATRAAGVRAEGVGTFRCQSGHRGDGADTDRTGQGQPDLWRRYARTLRLSPDWQSDVRSTQSPTGVRPLRPAARVWHSTARHAYRSQALALYDAGIRSIVSGRP